MADPTLGGLKVPSLTGITTKLGAYNGGKTTVSGGTTNNAGNKSTQLESLSLNTYIEPELEEYEKTEINEEETSDYNDISEIEVTGENLTSDEIYALIGTLTPEEYDAFVLGMEEYYNKQIDEIDRSLKGENGLYEMMERFRMYNADNIKQIVYNQDEFIREQVELKLQTYINGIDIEKLGITYEEFLEIDNKQEFILEHDPDIQKLVLSNSTYMDEYLEENYSDLGITTYEEFIKIRSETEAMIADMESQRKTAMNLRDSAKYDYLPFLEAYKNFEAPKFNKEEYKPSFYHDAHYEFGGGNNTSEYFSYSQYKEKHPEITPMQFIELASPYTNNPYCLKDLDNANALFLINKVADIYPQYKKTYEYLYEQDPAKASQYLKDIKYELNNIQGQLDAAEFLKGLGELDGSNDLLEAVANELGITLKGLTDGLDTFNHGMYYTLEALLTAVGLCEENRVMDPSEYKKMYILQALLPTEQKIKLGLIEYGEDGKLKNVDPNSIIDFTKSYSGPALNNNYEISQGIGNMLPSMVVSLYCPTAGSWLMGLSAGGNAYHGAMVEGKDYFTSLLYGAFSGASEAISERLLGGLPGLSDVQVTSLKTYLKAVVKEGTQEIFQGIMDRVYRHIAMGEPLPDTVEGWIEFAKELGKEGAYGAITAGILNVPSLITSIRVKRRAKLDSIGGQKQGGSTEVDPATMDKIAAAALAGSKVEDISTDLNNQATGSDVSGPEVLETKIDSSPIETTDVTTETGEGVSSDLTPGTETEINPELTSDSEEDTVTEIDKETESEVDPALETEVDEETDIDSDKKIGLPSDEDIASMTPDELVVLIDELAAEGDLDALVELEQKVDDIKLTVIIDQKLVDHVRNLDTTQFTNLIMNNTYSPKTVESLIVAITQAYTIDGKGFKADIKQVLETVMSKNPQMKDYYLEMKATQSIYYPGQVDKIETWMLLQYLQATKLQKNGDIDFLNLVNESYKANVVGAVPFDDPAVAYFDILRKCYDIREKIKSLTNELNNLKKTDIAGRKAKQAEIDKIYRENAWLATLGREVAHRNGHDTSIPEYVSFFQQQPNKKHIWDWGSVGRPNTASQGDGGTACCNADVVDKWIVQQMNQLVAENPTATAAEIEKMFIRRYYDYAALQDLPAWEAGFARAIATNISGYLQYTDGLCNSCFALEWCLGGETLGMNEEFLLTHGDITSDQLDQLHREGKCTVEVRDASGTVVGTYDLTYCQGLKETLVELIKSGRITDPEELSSLKLAYKKLYGEDI